MAFLPDAHTAMKPALTAFKENRASAPSRSSEIMSVTQASAFLAIHRNTLYKLITEGEIPAFRLTTGGRWKFRRSDLEDWLADRQARSVR
jgi:excisionase family DNA binding protein